MGNYTVWHPLNSITSGDKSINMVSGNGIYLKDKRGRTYIDGLCGLWNVSLGYGNPGVIEAVIEQIQKLPYINLTEFRSEVVEELGNRLIEILDADMKKIYFTCTGSESNELAIKLSRKYQDLKGKRKKRKIGVLKSSYHGSFYGSLSASQFETKHKDGYGPFLSDFAAFELPFTRSFPFDEISKACIDEMVNKLEQQFNGEEMAAFMIEPVIGSGGIIPIPVVYLKRLEELCKEQDVLLICDEVATGFGRTGKMFAYQHAGVKPDIVCMAKGINSGYLPMGAVAVNEKVYENFKKTNIPLFHLSTQNGNPICCNASLETIRQLEINNRKLILNVEEMGKLLKSELKEAIGNHPYVFDIRGNGLMVAVDLVESKITGEQFRQEHLISLVEKLKKVELLVEFCYNEKITSTISLFFAYIITAEEIRIVVDKIAKTLNNFV